MTDMMEDIELEKQYPVIAHLNKLRKEKEKNQTKEEKDRSHQNLVGLMTDCGFEQMLALLGKKLQN